MEPQQPNNTPPPTPAWTQYKPPAQPPMYPPMQSMQPMQQRQPSGVFVPTAVIVILAIAAVVVMCASTVFGYAIGATPIHATPTTDTTSGALLTTQQQPSAAQPTITATPAKDVVLTVSGNGNKTTSSFTVHGTWRMSWTCDNGGEPSYTTLGIGIYDAATSDYASNIDGVGYTCPATGGGDSSTFHTGGTFYLSIVADVNYTITVTDLPN